MSSFDALSGLDSATLIQLAQLLEAGLLMPPFGRLTIQDHVPRVHAETVAAWLNEIGGRQSAERQIALVLRAFAAGREDKADARDPIQIVVSGPDPSGTARDTGVVLRQLFQKARERVLAVGFAVHQGRSVFEALARRLDEIETLKVTLCLDVRRQTGSTSMDNLVVAAFARDFIDNEWPGKRKPAVFYDPRSLHGSETSRSALHAKCVIVDGREALVTSANFTEAAQERNIELGLLVDSAPVAERIERHFRGLIERNYLERLPIS